MENKKTRDRYYYYRFEVKTAYEINADTVF